MSVKMWSIQKSQTLLVRGTAYELFSKAYENTNKLDSYSMDMEMNMSASYGGITFDVPMFASYKGEGMQGDSPIMSMDVSTEVLGAKIEMDIYMDNDWTYYDMSEYGVKYKVSNALSEEANEYAETINGLFEELPKDILEGQTPVNNDDGSKTIRIEFPADKFSEIYKDLVESVSNMSVGAEGEIDFEIVTANAEYTISDGYFKECVVEFEFKISIEGVEMTITAELKGVYHDPGTPVKVTLPEGLEEYPEEVL